MWNTSITYPINLARKRQPSPLSSLITPEYFPRVAMELDNLKQAVDIAKDPENPDRLLLMQIYERTLKDLHLRSQIRTALLNILFAPFEVRRDGLPDDDLISELDAGWFERFLTLAFETELFGHSLIEFSFDDQIQVKLIPRQNVIPQLGLVKPSIYEAIENAIPYRENKLQWNLIELGDPDDLGILELASIAVIWKNYALSDWSEYMDRYGFPFLVIQTETNDPAELQKMKQMGDYFGFVRYIILGKNDDVKVEHARAYSGDYQTFDTFVKRMDEYLSKLINGQTATADEKAYVGAAEVHERILNKYTLARLKRIQRQINDILFPFLVQKGFKQFQNARFQFLDLELASAIDITDQKKTLD